MAFEFYGWLYSCTFLEKEKKKPGKEQNSGQFQRDLNFSIKIPPGGEADGDIKRGKTLNQVTKNTCCPLSAFQSP